jgi:hypothetical protein
MTTETVIWVFILDVTGCIYLKWVPRIMRSHVPVALDILVRNELEAESFITNP